MRHTDNASIWDCFSLCWSLYGFLFPGLPCGAWNVERCHSPKHPGIDLRFPGWRIHRNLSSALPTDLPDGLLLRGQRMQWSWPGEGLVQRPGDGSWRVPGGRNGALKSVPSRLLFVALLPPLTICRLELYAVRWPRQQKTRTARARDPDWDRCVFSSSLYMAPSGCVNLQLLLIFQRYCCVLYEQIHPVQLEPKSQSCLILKRLFLSWLSILVPTWHMALGLRPESQSLTLVPSWLPQQFRFLCEITTLSLRRHGRFYWSNHRTRKRFPKCPLT